eukprot:629533-Amphidinium_carterae.2
MHQGEVLAKEPQRKQSAIHMAYAKSAAEQTRPTLDVRLTTPAVVVDPSSQVHRQGPQSVGVPQPVGNLPPAPGKATMPT